MALKNKDGTPFKLVGPNPIMKGQNLGQDKFEVHNFSPENFISHDPVRKSNANLKIIISEDIPPPTKELVDINDIEPEEIVVPIIEPPRPPKRTIPDNVPKTVAHCLPAIVQKYTDSIYGETRSLLTYGEKFTLEVVIISSSDLTAQIWTNAANVTKESIIFLSNEKRWWKVGLSENKYGGILFDCVPSDITPSFSD